MPRLYHTLIDKIPSLTGTELNTLLYLIMVSDAKCEVIGVHHKDVTTVTGMQKSSFYAAMRSLCKKGIITLDREIGYSKHFSTYTVTIEANKPLSLTSNGYIKLNAKLFKQKKFWDLTPNAKWLLLFFLKATSAGKKVSYRKTIKDFNKEIGEDTLSRGERMMRNYIAELREFFNIVIKKGRYFVTRNRTLMELMQSKIYDNERTPARINFIRAKLKFYKFKNVSDKLINEILVFFTQYKNKVPSELLLQQKLGFAFAAAYKESKTLELSVARLNTLLQKEINLEKI